MELSKRKKYCRIQAPAKINLFLKVTGKRDDGYHDLVTWMQKLEISDEIELELDGSRGIRLRCDDQNLPVGDDNLVVKAARAFFAAAGVDPGTGLCIRLTKRIPVAAGLGGGSSDAGAVIRGLNSLYAEVLNQDQCIDMARKIGADVPFFVTDYASVLASGIGDVMKPLPSLVGYRVLLVNPGFHVSTAWVFEKFRLTRPVKESKLSCFKSPEISSLHLEDLQNDLEEVTFGKYPEVMSIRDSLRDSGAALAMMSGSGPTVYGLFSEDVDSNIQDVVVDFRNRYGKQVFLTAIDAGASPSGKAPGFDPGMRRFESCRPSHTDMKK